MHFPHFRHARKALLFILAAGAISCQPTDDTSATEADNATATSVTEVATPPRPAPDFYVLPPEMAKSRVWICVDDASDIFHEKHDCPVLVQCKGTFRNVTMLRAIEGFGRYNCQECSQHLDHIFDEDMVR